MEVPLIANRFAPLAGAFALDLGTGERVHLRIETVHDPPVQAEWVERCAALCGVWHPCLAECLDFGPLGSDHRFMAVRACRHATPRDLPGTWPRQRDEVEQFLGAAGVRVGMGDSAFIDSFGQPVVIPEVLPFVDESPAWSVPQSRPSGRWFGVRLVRRSVLEVVRDYLTAGVPSGLTATGIDAALGSGGRTLLRACAREARQHGFVPLSTAALRWIEQQSSEQLGSWATTLGRQHVVVLHDGRREALRQDHALLHALIRLGGREARARLILELTAQGGASRLRLLPLDDDDLVRMVVLGAECEHVRRRLRALARTARGRPAPFLRRIAQLCAEASPVKGRPYTVHERADPYGIPFTRAAGGKALHVRPSSLKQRWARHGLMRQVDGIVKGAPLMSIAAGDRRSMHDTIGAAHQLSARGRHAAAERKLRRVHAMASRRGAWEAAVEAGLALGLLQAGRGRIVEAERTLLAVLACSDRVGDAARSVVTVTWIGLLRLQDARVEEAESSLRSAATGSALLDEPMMRAWAASALALCLWWQGRTQEAHRALGWAGHSSSEAVADTRRDGVGWRPEREDVQVFRACTAARIALSLGEAAVARQRLADVRPIAGWGYRSQVHRLEARWSVAVGDEHGLVAASTEAMRAATESRQPLDRLRAMVGWLEGCLALGRDPDRSVVRGLQRVASERLPGLLALRVRLALARQRGGVTAEQIATECAARRLEALAPRGASASVSAGGVSMRSSMYEDMIEVLAICQEDEAWTALARVAKVVRERTSAAALELVAAGGTVSISLPSGTRRTTLARRAIDSGLPIDPVATELGLEAAVPLRFAGRIVGALVCRWVGPLPVEPRWLMGLLGAVAAAVAPCLHAAVEHQLAVTQKVLAGETELLGRSAAMEEVRRAIARAADAPFPVLIQGESGSGKELVARAIHRAGPRRGRAFSALNCAALPDDLLEAELFGHARGAFTGAVGERIGLFEEADGGVLFLDEVGELSARAQAKLLRAIQEGEIKRLGETLSRRVDVRIVAATNRSLEQEVAAGRFRRDLRYRLDVIRMAIPPLRERAEDVPLLVETLWRAAAARVGSRAVLSGSLVAALARYDWPGNVRELQNVLAALAVSAPRRGTVGPSALPVTVASTAMRATAATLEQARRMFEERYVRAALARSGGHRGRAAAELGVTRQGLAKLMGRLGVVVPESESSSTARAS